MTEPEEQPKKQRVYPRDASGKRVPTSKIVEAVRSLLAQGCSDGDVKRQLAALYSMKPRSFEKHLAAARARNRDQLNLTQADAKADATTFWTNKLQISERSLALSQRRLAEAQKRIDSSQAVLDDPTALKESAEQAAFILDKATEQCETLRLQINRAQSDSIDLRDRLDRLLGTLAPVKIAKTDAAGEDLPVPAPIHICEPSSMESAAMIVGEVLKCLPAGWSIRNELNQRLLPDGSFEGAEQGDVLLLPKPSP